MFFFVELISKEKTENSNVSIDKIAMINNEPNVTSMFIVSKPHNKVKCENIYSWKYLSILLLIWDQVNDDIINRFGTIIAGLIDICVDDFEANTYGYTKKQMLSNSFQKESTTLDASILHSSGLLDVHWLFRLDFGGHRDQRR